MVIEILKQDSENFNDVSDRIENWSCGLWFNDFDMANITACYVAYEGEKPIGFQTVNSDGFCVAIEVHPDYRNMGVGASLIKQSGCCHPDRNYNDAFWEKMEEKYGDELL